MGIGYEGGTVAAQRERENRRCRERGREDGISMRLLLLDLNDHIAFLFIVLSRLVS